MNRDKIISATVWVLRVAVGALFVVSGLSKGIDIWGFVYKIEEYMAVWHIHSWRSLNFVGALLLSSAEFVGGAMLAVGCFRRSVVWWLLIIMAAMLPLSAYIMVANPVHDCGCFGDFWIISNTATFLKNVVITAALVFLVMYNRWGAYIYHPYTQWIPMMLCSLYILIVALTGYNVQPLVDFRSFAPGSSLLANSEGADDAEPLFIYQKDGEQRQFPLSELPDSTWEFVEQQNATRTDAKSYFSVLDEYGDDISSEIIDTVGRQIIITIPDIARADISYTVMLNELDRYEKSMGNSMICLVGGGKQAVEQWVDYSLASYPVYAAEPDLIKELARGNMALVMLDKGVVQWKRTVSSMEVYGVDTDLGQRSAGIVTRIVANGRGFLLLLSGILVCLMLVTALPSVALKITDMVRKRIHIKKNNSIKNNDLNC